VPYLSDLEPVCSRQGAIQIHVYLYFYLFELAFVVVSLTAYMTKMMMTESCTLTNMTRDELFGSLLLTI